MVSTRRTVKYFDGTCKLNYCKKPGHKIADCYKRDQANQGAQKQPSHSNAASNFDATLNETILISDISIVYIHRIYIQHLLKKL